MKSISFSFRPFLTEHRSVISIVIPAYNEENAITDTVKQASAVLDKAGLSPYEIIVVDDASSDKTADYARDAGAKVVSHVQNFGYGRSLKDGIKAASYDIIAITDADGTYPIDRIPDLVTEHQKGFDMAVGTRTGKHYRESAFKAPLRKILKYLVEFAAGQKIPDINSGLRVFSRSTVLNYFPRLCNTFSFTTSLTLAYMLTGRSVYYTEIEYHKRVGATKVRLFKDALRTLHYIVQAILYYDPIKIFLILCALTILMGIFMLGLGILLQIHSAFLFAVGSLLVAIVVFALGLLADLLTQILRKSN